MQKIPQKPNQSQEEANGRKLQLEALPLENQSHTPGLGG